MGLVSVLVIFKKLHYNKTVEIIKQSNFMIGEFFV